MGRTVGVILVLLLCLPAVAADDKPPTPAEQYQALAKQFQEAAHAYYVKATNDEERTEALARAEKLSPQLLELAEKYPKDPVALDALVQVVTQETWLENNTSHPGRGQDNLEARALAILQRDHVQSDRLGEAC